MTNKVQIPKLRETNDIILSFPRSGNTFTRYFLEIVFQRPTWGYASFEFNHESGDWEEKGETLDLPLAGTIVAMDENKIITGVEPRELTKDQLERKPFFKRHSIKDLKEFNSNKDNLLLLIRNPYECLIREFQFIDQEPDKWVDENLSIFYGNLGGYENWQGDKTVVYFKEMVYSPEIYFRTITEFFLKYTNMNEWYNENTEEDVEEIKAILREEYYNFMKNYNTHRNLAKVLYLGYGGKILFDKNNIDDPTPGDINFHRKKDKEKGESIFELIKDRIENNTEYKRLTEKYMKNII